MNYTKLVVRLLLALIVVGMLAFYFGCSKDEPVAPLDNESGEVEGIATPITSYEIPDEPVPESEIAEIIFSETWLSENNISNSPKSFNITFPAKWLDESPKLTKQGESVVKLRLPKTMLEVIDENPDPGLIKVSLTRRWFYPNEEEDDDEVNIPEEMQGDTGLLNKTRATTDIQYFEHRQFKKKMNNITGLQGYCYTGSKKNDGESFTNYDESEIKLSNNDCVELVNAFYGNTNGTVTRQVKWVYYDSGVHHRLLVATPESYTTEMYFYFTIHSSDKHYYFMIHDEDNDTYYQKKWWDEDNFSSQVNYLLGTTELDCDFANNKDFYVRSYIKNLNALVGSTWKNADDCFSYQLWHKDDYTKTSYSMSSYIKTKHKASNDSDL